MTIGRIDKNLNSEVYLRHVPETLNTMDARLVAARLPGFAMYGSPYSAPNFPGYLSYGPAAAAVAAATDPTAFYSQMGSGENADVWRAGLSQAAAAYYDPAMAAHYGYGYGPMGLNDGARRKNATRETTSTLKAWLNEHKKNPYPTKGEKIMLAIITKMTLTQVSTWFANARRRLKKENKMTWSPRNRCGEDDDDDDINDDVNHGNVNNFSRSSSPLLIDSDAPPPSSLCSGPERSEKCNSFKDHVSGGGNMSDEGNTHSENRDERRHTRECHGSDDDRSMKTISPPNIKSSSGEEGRLSFPSSHFTRHNIHPYQNNARTSPTTPFQAMQTRLTSPVQSNPLRSAIPFPGAVPPGLHGSPGSQPMLSHPGVGLPGGFNPAAAASLLAASRSHQLPPQIVAALNEQAHLRHYQQSMQQMPIHPLLGNLPPNLSTNPSNTATSSVSASPPSTAVSSSANTSKLSPTVTSPSKPKIWSIADVATSSDSQKEGVTPKRESPRPDSNPPAAKSPKTSAQHSDDSPPKDHLQRNIPWMDNLLQQRLASAISANATNPGNPSAHQFQQLAASGLTQVPSSSIAHSSFVNGIRMSQAASFPGFAELLAAQEKANAALRDMARKNELTNKDTHHSSMYSPVNRLSDVRSHHQQTEEDNSNGRSHGVRSLSPCSPHSNLEVPLDEQSAKSDKN